MDTILFHWPQSACPIDTLRIGDIGEVFGMRGKAQGHFSAQNQKAAAYKRVMKEAQVAILQIPIKIDQDVPAGHEMDFGENLIRDKIMFSKYSPLPERLVEDCCPVGRRVIVRQR